MSRKTYLITAQFRVSGDFEHHIEEKHIIQNVESGIDEGTGEIELWGEYYGDYDWIETIFGEGTARVTNIKEFEIEYVEAPFCEHCGERHEDFGAQISDGGTHWCLNCFLSGSDKNFFSEEEIEEFWKEEKEGRKQYYIKKLKEMDD